MDEGRRRIRSLAGWSTYAVAGALAVMLGVEIDLHLNIWLQMMTGNIREHL